MFLFLVNCLFFLYALDGKEEMQMISLSLVLADTSKWAEQKHQTSEFRK